MLSYDLIRFFDHLVMAYFSGHPVLYTLFYKKMGTLFIFAITLVLLDDLWQYLVLLQQRKFATEYTFQILF